MVYHSRVGNTTRGHYSGDAVGVNDGEGPPVPIPNTEVKLTSAENTCLATDWEDRSMPTQKPQSFDCGFFHLCVITSDYRDDSAG